MKSIPIMCSYIFVSMAYGIMMEEAGFHWYYSLLVSLSVYTGAFQFVLVTLLSGGASFLTIALTAFFDEQPSEFLCPDLLWMNLQKWKNGSLHDPYHDG